MCGGCGIHSLVSVSLVGGCVVDVVFVLSESRERGGGGATVAATPIPQGCICLLFLSRSRRRAHTSHPQPHAATGHTPPTPRGRRARRARDARAGRPRARSTPAPDRRATADRTALYDAPSPWTGVDPAGAARARRPGRGPGGRTCVCVCEIRNTRAREAAGIKYIKAQRPQARTGHATTMHRGKHFYMSTCANIVWQMCVGARYAAGYAARRPRRDTMPPVTLRVGPGDRLQPPAHH